MNGGWTLTAPFVRHSQRALVICDVRGECGGLTTALQATMWWRRYKPGFCGVIQNLCSWMSQCSRWSSWVGTVQLQRQRQPQGRRSWPGSLGFQTGTPADRSGAGLAWRSPPLPFHHGTWAQRTNAAEGNNRSTNVGLQSLEKAHSS